MTSDRDREARQTVVIDAVNEHLKRYVVAVVPLDDETDQFDVHAGGSGVAVQIGDRRFVAVANHILMPPDERLTLMALDQSTRVEPGGIVRRVLNADHLVDVASLEIDDATAKRLGCEFFPLDRMRPFAGRLPVPAKVMLHGFPGALRESPGGFAMRAGAQGFCTVTTPTPVRHTPKPDLHLYCEYPDVWTRARGTAPAPSAEGYSGSGIWLLNYLEGKLWGPRHCQLVAIQTDWQVNQRWIRGTEIQHWLRLIAASYDDLRPLIERHLEECEQVLAAESAVCNS